jgi:hypothetical protein
MIKEFVAFLFKDFKGFKGFNDIKEEYGGN